MVDSVNFVRSGGSSRQSGLPDCAGQVAVFRFGFTEAEDGVRGTAGEVRSVWCAAGVVAMTHVAGVTVDHAVKVPFTA
jgi:hypothetical protein